LAWNKAPTDTKRRYFELIRQGASGAAVIVEPGDGGVGEEHEQATPIAIDMWSALGTLRLGLRVSSASAGPFSHPINM
jgi:hypothetical protein